MSLLEDLKEFAFIDRITSGLSKHPGQRNFRHSSDSEIVELANGMLLAVTVDTLQEEFQLGLIQSPETVGWCTVVHSLSDLAAVGAIPIGVLLALNLPRGQSEEWSQSFFRGVQSALERYGTHCLGGDTNFTESPNFTCTAIGSVQFPAISRIGGKPGDALYLTGPAGGGNLLGILRHVDRKQWEALENNFRPPARLREVQALKPWIKCAIDTSDALLQGLAILARLNQCGVDFDHREEFYDPRLIPITGMAKFPLWLVNVFGMGEYEVLFSASPDDEKTILEKAQSEDINLFRVGTFRREPGLTINMGSRSFDLDVPYLLNLFSTCSSVPEYLQKLVDYDQKMQ